MSAVQKANTDYMQKSILSENTLEQIKNRINETDSNMDVRAILTNSSKKIRVTFSIDCKNLSDTLFNGYFAVNNELNDMNIGEITVYDDTARKTAEAHAMLDSMKYSLLEIPSGGAELLFAFDDEKYSDKEKVKIFKEFFIMLSCDVLTKDMNLSLNNMKGGKNYHLIIKALNEIENPKKSEKLSFLLGTPFEIGGLEIKKDLEEMWISKLISQIMNKSRSRQLKVLIHGINDKSISLAGYLTKNDFTVVGIGEKGYSLYSQKGLSLEDTELVFMKNENEKLMIDYYDFLKKSADVFIEMSSENAIDAVIAEMLNVKAVAEVCDFSIQEYAVKTFTKRGITIIPSLLLSSSANIFNYIELLQKKRGDAISEDELELRFETYLNYIEQLIQTFDHSGCLLSDSLYLKAVKNYEKKHRILYGEKAENQ